MPASIRNGCRGVVGAYGRMLTWHRDLMVLKQTKRSLVFLMLTPTIAVVTNIDREHMDLYQT